MVEDSRKPLRGDANGVRRSKKFWNGFGKNKNGQVVHCVSNDEGRWADRLADDDKSTNIYVLDLFHFGMKGLDYGLNVSGGKKRAPEGDGDMKKKKKAKSEKEDLKMEGLKIEEDYTVVDSGCSGEAASQSPAFVATDLLLLHGCAIIGKSINESVRTQDEGDETLNVERSGWKGTEQIVGKPLIELCASRPFPHWPMKPQY